MPEPTYRRPIDYAIGHGDKAARLKLTVDVDGAPSDLAQAVQEDVVDALTRIRHFGDRVVTEMPVVGKATRGDPVTADGSGLNDVSPSLS